METLKTIIYKEGDSSENNYPPVIFISDVIHA